MIALAPAHPSWHPILSQAINQLDPDYLAMLTKTHWLPGTAQLFNAFTLPLANTRYILLGESPYPRADSANGYAFWDARVTTIWSKTGLSKPVNRATSLRNLIKMLLVAMNCLDPTDTTQPTIAKLDKNHFVQTLPELFQNFLSSGFLLLNASLVLSDRPVATEAKAWRPFLHELLIALQTQCPSIQLILLGKIAEVIQTFDDIHLPQLTAEHPYNLSFIQNQTVQQFFKPFELLGAS